MLRCGIAALAMCLPLQGAADSEAPMGEKEAAVRAAFLYRLAFFVNWEDSAFATEESPLRFCVVGAPPSPVAPLLRNHTRERSVGERAIEVEQRTPDSELGGCHLVYVESTAAISVANAPGQLVVVDSLDGLQRGGALALLAEQGGGQQKRLGFVSRRDRLPTRGVTLNARLLQLVRFHDEGAQP